MAKKTQETQNTVNIGFERQLWNAAEVLWGHIPAADYRKVIVGLIFLRYISTAFDRRHAELVCEGEGFEDDRDEYTSENIFFVPKEARWEHIAYCAHSPEIGVRLDAAMEAIEKENPKLKGVLPKIYGSPDLNKQVLGDVVDVFSNIDMSDTEQSRDLLGRTYEFCIAQFASYEGKKGGEFYTPASIVKILVEILQPHEGNRIYDPACGSGGMFVQSVKFIEEHKGNRNGVSIYGQEANADTRKMAIMNMAIRGIEADFGKEYADTFTNEQHTGKQFDIIMANPPFNLKAWGQEKLSDDPRWEFGLPPAGNANFAWIQHMIHHLSAKGKIGLVLANGALSAGGAEGDIRRRIVEADLVEGIIALPNQMFYSVQIPVTLWFFNKQKAQPGKTLFIDARQMGYMADRTHRDFTEDDIKKLADTFTAYREGTLDDEAGYCAVCSLEQIAEQEHILTPGRYVGIAEAEDDGVPFAEKMATLSAELNEMFERSHELEEKIKSVMKQLV